MQNVTTAFVFDQKKIQDPNEGIIKIRVTYKREKRFFTTGLKVSVADWQKLDRMKGDLDNRMKNEEFIRLHQILYGGKDTRQRQIEGILTKARKVIENLGANFTFEGFKDRLANYGKESEKMTEKHDVIRALADKQHSMASQGRIGTATMYSLVSKSLLRFVSGLTDKERRVHNLPIFVKKALEKPVIKFEQITVAFLNAYELWMLREGKASQTSDGTSQPASSTTVGIYCRHLRAVFNLAIEQGVITKKEYPFGRNRYIIPAGRNPKKALSTVDLDKVKQYEPKPDSSEQRAHDLWLFTYVL